MLLDEAGQFGGQSLGGRGAVGVEVEVERRVQEDRHEARPARRFLRLGAPAVPLPLEAQAGDDADDGPAAIAQMQQSARAPDGLVVGMRRHVQRRSEPRTRRLNHSVLPGLGIVGGVSAEQSGGATGKMGHGHRDARATDSTAPQSAAWFALDVDAVAAGVGSDLERGLTSGDAATAAPRCRAERDRQGEAAVGVGGRPRASCATR